MSGLLKNDGRIVSAESERIAEGGLDFPLLGFVEREVKHRVNFWIIGEVIDGGRHKVVLHSKDACGSLYRTCCAQQVAGHAFGRRYVEAPSILAKYFADGF